MAEALSCYDTLVLEKKWITQDSKSIAFSSFMSKASALLDKHGNEGSDGDKSKSNKRKKKKDNKKLNAKNKFKHVAPKASEPREKEANGKKCYYCDKPHGPDSAPMWTLHKPEDHKEFKPKPKPKEEDVELEFKDDLKSLLSAFKKDF